MPEMRIMTLGSRGEREDKDRQPRPDMDAQYHELAIRYRHLATFHQFKPGEFVRFKHGWSVTAVEERIGRCAWIFIRYLDPQKDDVDRMLQEEEVSGSGSCTNALGVDCVIATQGMNTAQTQPLLVSSKVLEPDGRAGEA